MTRVADIPAKTALLCEACGYTLHTAETAGNCPECGSPISNSLPHLRQPPSWEVAQGLPALAAWLRTSARALFQPSFFFRRLALPGNIRRSRQFRWSHHAVAALLLGLAAWIHADRFGLFAWQISSKGVAAVMLGGFIAVSYLLLAAMTTLVARLSAWEAAYRGLRLPRDVVDRGMDYHTVHLLPPSLVGLTTIAAYAALERAHANLAAEWVMTYLYVLAAEVVLAAVYLFITYWKAMRNLMYANPQGSGHYVTTDQP